MPQQEFLLVCGVGLGVRLMDQMQEVRGDPYKNSGEDSPPTTHERISPKR